MVKYSHPPGKRWFLQVVRTLQSVTLQPGINIPLTCKSIGSTRSLNHCQAGNARQTTFLREKHIDYLFLIPEPAWGRADLWFWWRPLSGTHQAQQPAHYEINLKTGWSLTKFDLPVIWEHVARNTEHQGYGIVQCTLEASSYKFNEPLMWITDLSNKS